MSRPFGERLAIARELIAHAPEAGSCIPAHARDQLQAASAETQVFVQRAGAFLKAVNPNRGWKSLERSEPLAEVHAHLLAALLDTVACLHLRKEGPQPAFAILPLRRLDCQRCVQTRRLPAAEDADRCDVCGTRGVSFFVPFACQSGPVLLSGDCCSRCAAVLLPKEAVA